MARIIAIDYGTKRTGLAVTDPLKIIASPLTTVPTKDLIIYLKEYFLQEDVELIVIGMPKNLSNQDTHSTSSVKKVIQKLNQAFPDKKVSEIDERFTSKIAFDAMIEGGLKKKDRKDKSTIDKVSAAVILQSYLEANSSI